MSFTNFSSPEKLYYDIQVSNLENESVAPPLLSFIETRNTPFLYDTSQYYMSIIRFSLDTPTLPLFIPTIQPNQNNINKTIYSVTLEWSNPLNPNQIYTQQSYIDYIPQNKSIIHPPPPSNTTNKLQFNADGYYYVYNYQYFIYLINNSLTAAFNALDNQVTLAGLSLPSNYAPVLSFNTDNNTAVLNCDILGYSTQTANYIKIYFNNPLKNLFNSFPYEYYGFKQSNGKNVQLITNTYENSNVIQFPPYNPQYNAIQVFQEYSTVSLWSPVTSIVFTSNTMPIVSNQVSNPVIYNEGNVIGSNGNNSLISQTITDFIANDSNYSPQLQYEASAQYRLIELISNRPLNTIDLNVFWKDKMGQLNSFYLSSGSTATVKMLFTKKNAAMNYK